MWETLYEEFWDRLEHFCARLCRDESRAEDLAQEVFLKALQNRKLLEGLDQRQCKAWLFTAARNLYFDQFRREKREQELLQNVRPEEGDADEVPDETADLALDEVETKALLEKLAPQDRALFTLRYAEGYNASELSEVFGMPPGTVRTRLRKIRCILQKELQED